MDLASRMLHMRRDAITKNHWWRHGVVCWIPQCHYFTCIQIKHFVSDSLHAGSEKPTYSTGSLPTPLPYLLQLVLFRLQIKRYRSRKLPLYAQPVSLVLTLCTVTSSPVGIMMALDMSIVWMLNPLL